MRIVRVGNGRECEVPTSWEEGEEMLTHVLGAYYDGRGGNPEKASCCARVAFGLFGKQFMAADPTDALVFLLQRICNREGAGLDHD